MDFGVKRTLWDGRTTRLLWIMHHMILEDLRRVRRTWLYTYPPYFFFYSHCFPLLQLCLLLPIFFFLLQALCFFGRCNLGRSTRFHQHLVWHDWGFVAAQRTDVLFSMIPITAFGLHPGKVIIRPDFVFILFRVGAVWWHGFSPYDFFGTPGQGCIAVGDWQHSSAS